jgi:hypothetical protein
VQVTARRDCEGSQPLVGSDRLLIRPAMWWARPVPAARGHFAAKAHPRRPVTSEPPALPASACHARPRPRQLDPSSRMAGYDPSHSPCRHQPGPEPRRAPQTASQVTNHITASELQPTLDARSRADGGRSGKPCLPVGGGCRGRPGAATPRSTTVNHGAPWPTKPAARQL